ncbi:MAG: hypothetical protein SCM11_15510 [Bacillota bacterium]|nr:hypothetical protein [Bacillota bacterium]
MKKVFSIDNSPKQLTDAKVNPKCKTGQVILPFLLGFLHRIKSLNELKFMLMENEFSKIFVQGTKLPQIDTIRDTLKVIKINGLKAIHQNVVGICK